jgi:hypothetical protein
LDVEGLKPDALVELEIDFGLEGSGCTGGAEGVAEDAVGEVLDVTHLRAGGVDITGAEVNTGGLGESGGGNQQQQGCGCEALEESGPVGHGFLHSHL